MHCTYSLFNQARSAIAITQEWLKLTLCPTNPPEVCQSYITEPTIIEDSLPIEFISPM